MVEKPWNKNKSRIKIHQTRDKKDNALHGRIIWKCWTIVDSRKRSNFVIIRETSKKKKKNFLAQISSLKYKFPVKRSEYSDNTNLFSPKKPEVFHE